MPLQPVEGIQGIQAYKDLAQEVASFSTAISRRIKGFVIKCRSLNNNYRRFKCIESFIQALPNIAEILQAEVENPLPTNKHDLVAAYTTKFHAELTNFLSISLNELEDIYKKGPPSPYQPGQYT